MKKYRNKMLVGFGVLLLSISIIGTYAYLVDWSYGHNKMEVGSVEAPVEENYNPPAELKPGISFKKEVWMRNTGNTPCFVRMQALFSNSDAEKYSDVDFNTTDWDNGGDGYYYYRHALDPGESTSNLFNRVEISSSVSQNDLVEFEILLYGEAIQKGDYTDYLAVWRDYTE